MVLKGYLLSGNGSNKVVGIESSKVVTGNNEMGFTPLKTVLSLVHNR